MNKKANIGAILFIATAAIVLSIAIFPFKDSGNLITGAATIASPFCNQNPNSCIDMNGDGLINFSDEDIFATILNSTIDCIGYPTNPGLSDAEREYCILADFDNNSIVDNDIDFQQCFVSFRDFHVDQRNRTVTCNRPIDDVTGRDNHTGCTDGCPDINGDGYVDDIDFRMLVNDSIFGKRANETKYPMADLTGDGEINVEDKFCFTPYMDKIVTCNLQINALLNTSLSCPDLTNEFDVGNDGRVNESDESLFDSFIADQNLKADFNGDGRVTKLDEYILDQHLDNVIDCNIFHAPWHIGGLDQNNSGNVSWDSFSFIGGSNIASQIFKTGREGQLPKIRVYLDYESNPGANITVRIYNNNETTGDPDLESLVDSTILETTSTLNSSHFETIRFSAPPVLDNDTKYHIVLSAPSVGESTFKWFESTGARGALNSSDDGASWTNTTDRDYIFETFITTACADLNGDGVVDGDDETIIDSIPDGITTSGTGSYTASYDLNSDSVINETDAEIISDALGGSSSFQKPPLQVNNSASPEGEIFGNTLYKSQSFIPLNTKLSIIELYLADLGADEERILLEIQENNGSSAPNGTVVANATIDGITNNSFNWYNFTFSDAVTLSLTKNYSIVLSSAGSVSSSAYNWSDGTIYAGGNASSSSDSGANFASSASDFVFRVYAGDPEWNESYDLNSDWLINGNDILLINSVTPSYDGSFFTPLVDFNALFGIYERGRDKTLGFDAYEGKVLECGLDPILLIQELDNGRCEPDIGENYSNSYDCVACNEDGFCHVTEDFNECSDCELLRNLPIFSSFDFNTTTNFVNVSDISQVGNAVLELIPFGRIEFLESINFTQLNLDEFVNISSNNISINVSALPELNVSAAITLFNLDLIYPRILRNSVPCPASICQFVSYEGSNFKFNVSGFALSPVTWYQVEERSPDVSLFNGSTTNFSIIVIQNIESVPNITLEKEEIGKINFLDNINASNGNYSRDVDINLNGGTTGGGNVFVNSSEDDRLNISARITLFNLSLKNPVIRVGDIASNLTLCPEDVCAIESYPQVPNTIICDNNCTLVFNATHFTTYHATENTTAPQFINGPIPNFNFSEGSQFVIDIADFFFDVDNTTLIYNATILEGASNINITGIVNSTITFFGQNGGTGKLVYNVSDGVNSTLSNEVLFVVESNLPPELNETPSAAAWDEDSNQTLQLLNYYSDPDGDELTFNFSFIGDATNMSVFINQSSGVVIFVPGDNFFGQRYGFFIARDEEFNISTGLMTLTVNSINDPPEQTQTLVDVGEDEGTNVSINLSLFFEDAEDEFTELNFSLNSSPENFSINFSDPERALFVPQPEDFFGSERFVIKVQDTDGAIVFSNRFTIGLAAVPDDLIRTNLTFNISWMQGKNISLNLSDYFYDPDNNVVYFAELSDFSNLSVQLNVLTGKITFISESNFSGIETANLSAQDTTSLLSEMVNLTVLEINDTNSTFVASHVNGTFYNGVFSNVSGIFDSVINISNITGPIISVENSVIFNSTIINSSVSNCTISDSTLQDSSCENTVIDPSTILNSNTPGSTIIDSTIIDSNATFSRIEGGTINNSNVNNSNVTNSTLYKTEVKNANITNDIIYSGNVTYPNGTMYDASASGSKNLSDIVNYPPTPVIAAAPTSGTSPLTVTFNASSSIDSNIGGELDDVLNYSWDFDSSDGIQADNTSNVTSHTYSEGSFTATLTATDRFGENDTATVTITASAAGGGAGASGGGGGGGGGGRRCFSSWNCTEWTGCTNGVQTRTCTDSNNCRTPTTDKPEEVKSCGCIEEWQCGGWSVCASTKRQTRACRDLNACGTEATKPATIQSCSYVAIASCYDRMQNQGETGIDCGGPCASCAAPIKELPEKVKNYVWLYVLLIVILLGGIGFVVYEMRKPPKGLGMQKIRESKINLEQYIKKTLDQGFSRKRIYDRLVKEGWKKKTIEEIFKKVGP